MVSIADIPSGNGLGSSGAFIVCLLNALHAYKREYVPLYQLAEEACKIEMEILNAGDMVYDPPNMIHAGRFLEDTVELAFCTEPRNQDNYEADTIRVKLI